MPFGQRRDDPPPETQTLRFRVALRLRRNPILTAFTVALCVCAIPLVLILVQQGEIKQTQADAVTQRRETISLVCTQNDVLVTLLLTNPIPAGRAAALSRLSGQNCRVLLAEVGGSVEIK